ncbi:hypothetical protein GPECTOR_49g530 [Gonium pectorale]|uniref:Fe2OG dioxygenase domain-containing protein n=1 Tax=Gonium pectorale TaxID=33097 RepID=A0A150G7V2_GONPE|nr:hypothetical protein GPECTOR_49g530 [Gonium pectorale]|eukprot:KXZ45946.1 hypothetical protein GPECTOR_49g530 [Gonium pectorale]
MIDLPGQLPDYVGPAEEEALLREVRASKAKWVQLSGRRLQNHGGVVHTKGLIPAPLPSWLGPLLRRLAAEGGDDGGGEGSGGGGLYGGRPPNHVLVNSYHPGEGIMPHEDGPAYHPVVAILSLGAPAVLRFRRKPRRGGEESADPEAASGPQRAGEAGEGTEATEGAGSSPPTAASAAPASSPSPGSPSAGPAPVSASVLLQPRSLVVFRDEAFTHCLHSIDEVYEERLDESVANLHMYGMEPGGLLPRGGERISLTVRRVARVLPSLLRPRGAA